MLDSMEALPGDAKVGNRDDDIKVGYSLRKVLTEGPRTHEIDPDDEFDEVEGTNIDFDKLLERRSELETILASEEFKYKQRLVASELSALYYEKPDRFRHLLRRAIGAVRRETNYLKGAGELGLVSYLLANPDSEPYKDTEYADPAFYSKFPLPNFLKPRARVERTQIGGYNVYFHTMYSDVINAGGHYAGVIRVSGDITDSMSLIDSLMTEGILPKSLRTTLHELSHGAQADKWGLFGKTELIESQARRVDTMPSQRSQRQFPERRIPATRNEIVDVIERADAYKTDPATLDEAASLIDQLYALGYGDMQIAKMISSKMRTEGVMELFRENINRRKNKYNLTDNDVENLITARRIETEIERLNISLVVVDEIGKSMDGLFDLPQGEHWEYREVGENLREGVPSLEFVRSLPNIQKQEPIESRGLDTSRTFSLDGEDKEHYFESYRKTSKSLAEFSYRKEQIEVTIKGLRENLCDLDRQVARGEVEVGLYQSRVKNIFAYIEEAQRYIRLQTEDLYADIIEIEGMRRAAIDAKNKEAKNLGYESASMAITELKRLKQTPPSRFRKKERLRKIEDIENLFDFDLPPLYRMHLSKASSLMEASNYYFAEGKIDPPSHILDLDTDRSLGISQTQYTALANLHRAAIEATQDIDVEKVQLDGELAMKLGINQYLLKGVISILSNSHSLDYLMDAEEEIKLEKSNRGGANYPFFGYSELYGIYPESEYQMIRPIDKLIREVTIGNYDQMSQGDLVQIGELLENLEFQSYVRDNFEVGALDQLRKLLVSLGVPVKDTVAVVV